MIRKFCRVLIDTAAPVRLYRPSMSLATSKNIAYRTICASPRFSFATLPRHEVLRMPALSPTMEEGKILKWLRGVGDEVDVGDILCEIQTDKATVGFEVQEKGFVAQITKSEGNIKIGTPVVVIVKKKDLVKDFANYSLSDSPAETETTAPPAEKPAPAAQTPKPTPTAQTSKPAESSASYPRHSVLKMPALSPTMQEGKIAKWNIKEGDEYQEGDSLCEIETDKATVSFDASEKGVLAKIIVESGNSLKIGETLAVSVKKKADADKFKNFTLQDANNEKAQSSAPAQSTESQKQPEEAKSTPAPAKTGESGSRVFASPAAKTLAAEKGINLQDVGSGSGPDGRIIRQDVESYTPSKVEAKQEVAQKAAETPAPSKPKPSTPAPSFVQADNPYEQIPVNNMRKTIAARLTESKTTIPHYYINMSVEMGALIALREQLNLNEKENGVKISVNDIMVKAMALALRDFPGVNSQWHGNVIKRFKHADVSVAVATDGGLITPIVFKADTLGLLDISRRTKDIAKRAREGKLDPREYIGGTSTISNIGMFGVNSVTSVINPPQSTILGVGKTEKKIIFDENSTDPAKPYRVAEICELIVSADHRVVDGAVAAQWIARIKKYIENPSHMLL